MNICHFMGNFVRDPELRETKGGKKVLNFTLGINRRFKRGKESTQEAAFIDCEAWDTGAELIGKIFKKGDAIIIHCSVKEDTWEKDGEKRRKLKFRVNQFDFVPVAKRHAEEPESEDLVPVGVAEENDSY